MKNSFSDNSLKCNFVSTLILRSAAVILILSLLLAFIPLGVHAVTDTATPGTAVSDTSENAAAADTADSVKTKAKKNKKLLIGPGISDEEAIELYGTYKGKNAKRIPVITYHRVVSDRQKLNAHPYPSLYVSQSDFRQQMKWLKKNNYRTISCQEFCLWYDGKIKLPAKSVLITFDDSRACLPKYAFPIMKKYGIKGTVFTIGHGVIDSDRDSIKKKQIKKLLKKYPTVEFQSHTYALHYRYSEKGDYKKVLKDAKKQSKYFSFEYVAYPFGRNTPGMRKAYKKAGIKMGFTYGSNGYATRKQNRYQIRRIKIDGNGSFSQFRRWFK